MTESDEVVCTDGRGYRWTPHYATTLSTALVAVMIMTPMPTRMRNDPPVLSTHSMSLMTYMALSVSCVPSDLLGGLNRGVTPVTSTALSTLAPSVPSPG